MYHRSLSRPASLLLLVAAVGFIGCDLFLPTPTVIGGGGERPPREGEGEEGEGEEGEGEAVGEGEGEVVGEGEGEVVGEGEGEVVSEGEGEGEVVIGDLVARLTWSGDSDLDVRGIAANANAAYCAETGFFANSGAVDATGPLATVCVPANLACSFSNCRRADADRPDWDGDLANSGGDPIIDIDDLDGLGPENLSVAELADGDYLIGAFAFNVAGSDCATLELTVGRQSIVRSIRMVEGDWVELAEVSSRGGSTTITALEGQSGAVCR